MKYSIREAREEEVFHIADICEAVLKEAPTYTALTFDKDKASNLIYGAIMKQQGWWLRVIANDADTIVGGLCCYCGESDFGPDKIAYDITIMVDEEYRGKCLKELIQLVDAYKTWALAEGAKVIKMGVSSGINIDKASTFFASLGFKRIGAMHGYILGE